MNLHTLILIPFLIFSFSACKSAGGSNNTAKSTTVTESELKHGTRIIIQYSTTKDQTTIYQQNFNMTPEVTARGKKLSEQHRFEIHNSGTYKGKNPTAAPLGLVLTLTHVIPDKTVWQFPAKTKLVFFADGERIAAPVSNQTKLDKDTPTERDFYETIIAAPTIEMYSKISRAKSVEVQLGTGSFDLTEDHILAFRDFTDYLTVKN